MVWQAALGCLLHLTYAQGQPGRHLLTGLPVQSLAQLLHCCARFRWCALVNVIPAISSLWASMFGFHSLILCVIAFTSSQFAVLLLVTIVFRSFSWKLGIHMRVVFDPMHRCIKLTTDARLKVPAPECFDDIVYSCMRYAHAPGMPPYQLVLTACRSGQIHTHLVRLAVNLLYHAPSAHEGNAVLDTEQGSQPTCACHTCLVEDSMIPL